jgi:cytochrome b561
MSHGKTKGDRPPVTSTSQGGSPDLVAYSTTARLLHWLTVALLAVQIPVGLVMVRVELPIDIYSGHKLLGLVILTVVVVRLIYRLVNGAPPDEPTLEPWQKIVSHVTHWALYLLLIVVAMLGWLGISYYPALDAYGIHIPALVSPDRPTSERVLAAHMIGALVLIVLAGMHVGAALFHYVIRKDGVLNRMLPGLPRRD